MSASFLLFSLCSCLFRLILCSKGDFKLLILHANDMHARFEQTNEHIGPCSEDDIRRKQCFGGFPRMMTAIKMGLEEAKSLNIPSLVLNAGDSSRGTFYYTLKKWEITSPLIDAFNFDVITLGNHEFDDGIDNVVNFMKHVRAPFVSCNLDLETEPRMNVPNLNSSIVLEIEGKKVGILGFVLPETVEFSQTENLVIHEEMECIRTEVKRLKESGVNIIIALSHSGFDRDLKIAAKIPELGLIVGGHTHTLLYSPKDKPPSLEPAVEYPFMVNQPSGKVVPIVQSYAYTKYLGKLWVSFDDDGNVKSATGNSQLLDYSIPEDADMKALVDKHLAPLRQRVKSVIGYARFPLQQADPQNFQFESSFGNLVADALVDYAVQKATASNSKYWTDAAVAIVNMSGLRGNLGERGTITVEDVMAALPFGTTIIEALYPGYAIKAALEHSLTEDMTRKFPNYIHFSGMRVVYDLSKPANKRVESVSILCRRCRVPQYLPMKYEKLYKILLPSFLFRAGHEFVALKALAQGPKNLYVPHWEVVSTYVERLKWIYPVLDGRVIVKNKRPESLITIPYAYRVFH